MKKLFIIFCICLLPALALGTDYYVRPSGGSYGSENGTSYANAWDGFTNVNWTTVDSGNGTLWICGTHTEGLSVGQSGEDGTPIIADGDCSTQGGSDGIISANGVTNGVSVSSRSYVTIRNLEIGYGEDNIIYGDNSSYLIVEYNTLISDGGDGGQTAGLRCQSCTSPTFQYNDFQGVGTSGQPDGLFIQYGSGTVNIIGNKFLITNTSSGHNDCMQFNQNAQDINIIGNYCEQDNTKTSDAQGIYSTQANGGTWNIIANVVVLDYSTNAIVPARIPLSASTYNVYNNVVNIRNPQSTSYRMFWFDDNNTGGTFNVKNNICYHTGSQALCWNYSNTGSATINHDYNLTYCPNDSDCWDGDTFAQWQSGGNDTNGDSSNPSLDSDFRPDAANDPSVGAGVVLGASYDDGLSIDMTIETWVSAFATVDRDTAGGATWDIGAYEYAEESPEATPTAQGLKIN